MIVNGRKMGFVQFSSAAGATDEFFCTVQESPIDVNNHGPPLKFFMFQKLLGFHFSRLKRRIHFY